MPSPQNANRALAAGLTLHRAGRLMEAERAYGEALTQNPKLAEAQHLLGVIAHQTGRAAQARAMLSAALDAKPRFAEAMLSLAALESDSGNSDAAIALAIRALALKPSDEAKAAFTHHARLARRVPVIPDLSGWLVKAIEGVWCWPRQLGPFVANVLKRNDGMAYMLLQGESGAAIPDDTLTTLARDPLVLAYLQTIPNADPHIERALTLLRTDLLARAAATNDERALLDLACALARQCYLNEYVFEVSEREHAALITLRADVERAPASATPFALAMLAAYQPLRALAVPEVLLALNVPKALHRVFVQQIREPQTESALKSALPALTPISDSVSQAVAAQYEENPYPLWTAGFPRAAKTTPQDYLHREFPGARPAPIPAQKPLEILVAGCGTGLQTIHLAHLFADARLTAIDLSRSSLAFAKRKADEASARNVTFAQADILALANAPELAQKRFALIECAGVLHHLADPFAGWRILLDLLAPGGVMHVGLYSEIARADVIATRAFVAARGFAPDTSGIRQARAAIMAQPDAALRSVMHRADFYSVSECRDLLFHVQEHNLHLPQIADFIAAQNLTFIGFDLPGAINRAYSAAFQNDPARLSLANWAAFEREHPETFATMYQFWVQKPA